MLPTQILLVVMWLGRPKRPLLFSRRCSVAVVGFKNYYRFYHLSVWFFTFVKRPCFNVYKPRFIFSRWYTTRPIRMIVYLFHPFESFVPDRLHRQESTVQRHQQIGYTVRSDKLASSRSASPSPAPEWFNYCIPEIFQYLYLY